MSLDKGKQSMLLSTQNMKEHGYDDPAKMEYVIRYGKGRMSGYAADCFDESDYAHCNAVAPLSEENLRDLQDYLLNRAASGWTGSA